MLNRMKRSTSTFCKLANSMIHWLILVAALGTALAADSPLVGVWQLDAGPSAQAGLYLFTPRITAWCWRQPTGLTSPIRIKPRPRSCAPSGDRFWPMLEPSDISGDLLTIRPTVAKIPVVMKEGANEVCRSQIENKTLTLQQVRNARGVTVVQAATLKLIRVE